MALTRLVILALSLACLLHHSAHGQTLPTTPGASCRIDGAPRKCEPFSLNIIQDVQAPATFTADSTCSNEVFCGRSNPFEAGSSLACATCPVPDETGITPVGFVLSNLYDIQPSTQPEVERSRWQSGILPGQNSAVVLVANLARTFIVASFSFAFYHTKAQAVVVEKSVNDGATFTPYVYFAVDCVASFGIVPETEPNAIRPSVENPNITVCVPITSPGLGGPVFYNFREDRISTAENPDLQTEIQIDEDPNLQEWLSATNFRVSLVNVSYPDGVAGNSSFNFFSGSNMFITGVCQCFGHASGSCEAGNTPCACDHRTTGLDCSICLPGFVDVPWRPSTLRSPFECQGKREERARIKFSLHTFARE